MTTDHPHARFSLGSIGLTPGARDLLAAAGIAPRVLLARHVAGDWGDIPPEDARENALSLRAGFHTEPHEGIRIHAFAHGRTMGVGRE